ncbi:hypothetical protein FRB95_005199 [Tulasnella sp. JGI-2019a]|nr:hypothetical protein FRB95_005199 [Tulasnella sp. JGI-2019a]
MPSPSSIKPEYTAPSLKYLVIYNPTLKPPEDESDQAEDDDDAIEQSHILFYTASQRAVARGQMLRQVGLAKALNSFSEMFSGAGCDSVHSQRARMVMVEPEPDFWMLASIDVPRTAQSKDKPPTSSRSKSAEKPKAKSTTELADEWDYKENVLFNDYLRVYMLRGYEQFKLLNGTFASFIETDSRTALEKLLEKFFTTWSWNWDVNHLAVRSTSETTTSDALPSKKNGVPEFSKHLGLPLHPSTSPGSPDPAEVTEALQNLLHLAPAPLIPLVICLHPPSIFPSRPDAPVLPESLPRYLLSAIPTPTSRQRRISGASTATLRRPEDPSKPHTIAEGNHPSNMTMSFIPPLGKLHMGMTLGNVTSAVNPKKWAWPGYLSFGHGSASVSAATSRDPSPSRGQEHSKVEPATVSVGEATKAAVAPAIDEEVVPRVTLEPPATTAEGDLNAVVEILASSPLTPHEPESTVAVDQSLLDDAISTPGGSALDAHESPTNPAGIAEINSNAIGGLKEKLEEVAAQATVIPPQALDLETPKSTERPLEKKEPVTEPAVKESQHVDLATESEAVDDVAESTTTSSHATIYLDATPESEDSQEHTTSRRKLLYYVRDCLVFAVVLPDGVIPTFEESTESFAISRANELLGQLGDAVDRWTLHCERILTGKSQPSDVASQGQNAPNSTRHILCDVHRGATTCSVGFESTSSHFFTSKQLLSRFPAMHEIMSRTDSSQWFAAKRQLTEESGGRDSAEGGSARRTEEIEVYAEISRKDASLVDVEREVDQILQNR